MPNEARIHEIKRRSLMDVPGKLRDMARLIKEAGTPTAVLLVGRADGRVSVYGFGERSSALQVSGWLARAQQVMTDGSDAGDGDGFSSDPPAA